MDEEHLLVEETRKLIEGCLQGNRLSQNLLYNLYSKKMFLVCVRLAKNREEAEEILQEGFVRVFEFMHQYKFSGSFEGWIRKIIVNCALRKFKSKGQLHGLTRIDATVLDNIGNESIISQLGTKELLLMVQRLPPAYRMVFSLYVFEGMKHREIARHLNIAEGTSKSNLSDARLLLQKAVKNSLQTSQNSQQL